MSLYVIEIQRNGVWKIFAHNGEIVAFTTKKQCKKELDEAIARTNKGFWNAYKTRVSKYVSAEMF